MKHFKKWLALLLTIAMAVGLCAVTVHADTDSGQLLPASISTFETGVGVTAHDHLTYLNDGHIYSKNISGDALAVTYYGYAVNYTTPMWLLGSYIRAFAQQNEADEYVVNVSMDVKGSTTGAYLAVRRFNDASDTTFKNLKWFDLVSNTYTTMSGSFTLTKEEALAAQDSWYALCLAGLYRPAELGAIYFDNVTLNVTAVQPLAPTTLPAEISTFEAGIGVTAHDHLTYLNDGHIYSKNISGDALAVNYYGYASNYTTPMWLLGSYIKAYAQQNEGAEYIVSVSMDVKGSINNADLTIRRYKDSSDNKNTVMNSFALTSDVYTTLSGTFKLTKEEALAAQDTWYALCLMNIVRPASLGTVYFDNVTLNVTVPEPETKILGANLALGENLSVNYVTYLAEGQRDHAKLEMKFTYNEREITVAPVFGTEEDQCVFPFTDINPQCMNDTIKAELFYDGEKVAEHDGYSVRAYCENMYGKTAEELNLSAEKVAELKKLLASLLVYGAESQLYVDYKTDTLANDGLAWAVMDTVTAPTGVKNSVPGTADEAKISSAGLRFSYVNMVFFRVKAEDLTDLTLTVNANGTETTVNVADLMPDGADRLYYSEGINAYALDTVFTATLKRGTATIQTVTYSVDSYLAAKWNDAAIGSLVQALYAYGTAAEAYAG